MSACPVCAVGPDDLANCTAPAGLMEAFEAYEAALLADDTAVLDAFFATGPHTLRGDDLGLLVGHEEISRFRKARRGVAPRQIINTHVRTIDPHNALIVSVSRYGDGRQGLQTQAWTQFVDGWKITAAHVTPARKVT